MVSPASTWPRQVEAHRWDQVVKQALQEHVPAQAAKHDRLTREETGSKHKVRKILDTTQTPRGVGLLAWSFARWRCR